MSDTRFHDDAFNLNRFDKDNKVAIAPGKVVKFFHPQPASLMASVASSSFYPPVTWKQYLGVFVPSYDPYFASRAYLFCSLRLNDWDNTVNIPPKWYHADDPIFGSVLGSLAKPENRVLAFPRQGLSLPAFWDDYLGGHGIDQPVYEGITYNLSDAETIKLSPIVINPICSLTPARNDINCAFKTLTLTISWSMIDGDASNPTGYRHAWVQDAPHPVSGTEIPNRDQWQAAIAQAFQVWQYIFYYRFGISLSVICKGIESNPIIPFTNTYNKDATVPPYNTIGDIRFYMDDLGMDVASALTNLEHDIPYFGKKLGGDRGLVRFNTNFRWRRDTTFDPYSRSIEMIAFHELGHLFTLDDARVDWSSSYNRLPGNLCLEYSDGFYVSWYNDISRSFGRVPAASDAYCIASNYPTPNCCDMYMPPDLLFAIKERQQAFGITLPWSASDPYNVSRLIDATGITCYTLLQLKDYVNALCRGMSGSFIASGYVGGSSKPTWLAATYANGATTTAELLVLVLAMEETWKEDCHGYSFYEYYEGESRTRDTRENTIAISIANYHLAYSGQSTGYPFSGTEINPAAYETYTGGLYMYSYNSIVYAPSAISKIVKFWCLPVKYDEEIFDAQGYVGLVENNYYKYYTSPLTSDASVQAGLWPSGTPPNWLGSGTGFLGFKVTALFVTFRWTFTDVL